MGETVAILTTYECIAPHLAAKNHAMSNPYEFIPPDIVTRLAAGKAHIILLLKKGENYGGADFVKMIQSLHLPCQFHLPSEGIMSFSMPVTRMEGDLAGIGGYNLNEKEELKKQVEADPP